MFTDIFIEIRVLLFNHGFARVRRIGADIFLSSVLIRHIRADPCSIHINHGLARIRRIGADIPC